MSTNRFITVGLAVALALAAVFTVRQAVATAEVEANTVATVRVSASTENPDCPFTDNERMTLHSEYFAGVGWILVSDNGPVGYDGGMLILLKC